MSVTNQNKPPTILGAEKAGVQEVKGETKEVSLLLRKDSRVAASDREEREEVINDCVGGLEVLSLSS